MITAIVCVFGLIFGGVLTFGAIVFRNRLKALRETELVDVRDLEEGRGKVTGTVVALEEPIKSPITQTACVYFALTVEEEEVRLVPYTETRRQGNRTVRVSGTREERKWVQILHDVRYVAFVVKDKTGEAEVEMDGAETVIKEKDRKASGDVGKLSDKAIVRLEKRYAKDVRGGWTSKKRRYREEVICEDDTLLVMGQVEYTDGDDRPLIAKAKKVPLVVSDQSDEQLQKHYKVRSLWCFIGAALVVTATVVAAVLLKGK